MKTKSRAVTIMVHKDGDLESRSFRLPLWLVRVAATSSVALLVLIALAAILYAPIARTAARVPGLNREIRQLRSENEQVRQLAATLQEMEARYEQVRTMLGANLIPERARAEGSVPAAYAIIARPPGTAARYESGASVPNHWPLDERGVVTRGPVGGDTGGEAHTGLDIAVSMGTPIRAAGGGVVEDAGQDPEYGLFVLISHPDGYQSMYGHASRVLVGIGDTVGSGQVIGLSGSTGRSTAPHLHFEIRHGGRSIDPRSLVNEES